MKVLIIGYGNPLREDDGIGWAAATAIADWQIDGCVLQVEMLHQLLPELADPLSQVDLAIFIDAAVSGEPGEIRAQQISMPDVARAPLTHHVDVAGLLTYAQSLFGRAPRAYLFTVTAASLGYAERLTPVVAAALPELLAQVRAVLSGERKP